MEGGSAYRPDGPEGRARPLAFSTMDLPDGYGLRAPIRDELQAVADVLVADELDDGGHVVLGADFIQGVWSRPDFDLGTDAWVAIDGAGSIVGYAQARRDEPTLVESWGVVHPAHRGRGIGSSLFGRVEEHAVRLLDGRAGGRFRHSINAGDRAAASMLEERGLRPVRHFWHMQMDLTGPVEAAPAPGGIEIAEIDAPETSPSSTRSSSRRSSTTGDTIRSRSRRGSRRKPPARGSTRPCGCSRRRTGRGSAP